MVNSPKTTKNANFMIGNSKRLSLFVIGKFYFTVELMLGRKLAQPLWGGPLYSLTFCLYSHNRLPLT